MSKRAMQFKYAPHMLVASRGLASSEAISSTGCSCNWVSIIHFHFLCISFWFNYGLCWPPPPLRWCKPRRPKPWLPPYPPLYRPTPYQLCTTVPCTTMHHCTLHHPAPPHYTIPACTTPLTPRLAGAPPPYPDILYTPPALDILHP